ncbi:MAG TPA: TonB-dependent receptor [Fontimonas sp.]
MRLHTGWATLFIGALALAPGASAAQTGDDPRSADVPTIAVAPAAEASGAETLSEAPPAAAQLETIVVTGELLTRYAERTTTSVGVHTGAEIERSVALDVYDVLNATPNARWHDSELGLSSITLRGIGSYGTSQLGAGTIYGTATAIVVDGVALPRGAMGFADLSAFDLDQVEVFRGPQSTSQGRNAMAGAVIINTAEPSIESSFAPELRGRLAGGSDGAYQGAAAAGATLWADHLAVRVTTDHRADDGDVPNVTRDDDKWAHDNNHGTRLRARFAPSGVDGAYEALLSAGELRRETGNRYVEQSRESERVATAELESYVDNEARLSSLEQRLRLGDHWTLRSISAYADSTVELMLDVDYSAKENGFIAQIANSHSFSQELRASFDADAWRGTLGLYYFRGKDGETSSGVTAVSALIDAVGLCPVELVCEALPLGNVTVLADAPARFENYALFGEVDWDATERLTLTAGLRVDRERNGRHVVSEIDGDTPFAQLAVFALQNAGVLGENGETDVSRRFSAVLPKVAASYEIYDGGYLGAAYTEGYRPGGEGYNFGSGRRYSFDAERTRNVELSFKTALPQWRTQLALNLFHTDWDDMQAQVGELLDSYIENAGKSRIRGGELELRSLLLDSLRMVAGVGVTRGRFIEFVTTTGDFSGYPLPKAPEYSATLALEWMPFADFLIRPEAQWIGSTPAQVGNAEINAGPAYRLDAHTLINLSLRWQPGRLGFFFNGSNLTDEHYRQDAVKAALGGDLAALGYGRRLVGGVEFKF